MKRRPMLVSLMLVAACGDDAAPTDTTADLVDAAAETTTAPVDTAPADTTPAEAPNLYARLKATLVNGRTTVTVAADTPLTFSFDYTAWAAADCPECHVQIVIGSADGTRVACADLGVPGVYPGTKASATADTTAPATAGAHAFAWSVDAKADCAAATAAFTPGTATTLLEILVQ